MTAPYFTIDDRNASLALQGDWVIADSAKIRAAIKELPAYVETVDARAIKNMDLWGALTVEALATDKNASLIPAPVQERLRNFIPLQKADLPEQEKTAPFARLMEGLGRGAVETGKTAHGLLSFIGEISYVFAKNIVHPKRFRFHAIIRHIEETGIRALPIICLLAVLISMVISYQAATQLQRFGASIFTVDLTVISILREMGVLTTAIMVAGRSGSAFAAEIGVMKLREEVDAMKTMGLDPIEVLVLPRLIAMLITLPILAFLSDLAGLAGGGLVSILLLDIPIDQYIERVDQVAKPTMFFVGLIKAPVFAFVITIIGTYQGMNVSGSAESVGKLTTVAVVQSIFLVIMVDALFSIVFSQLGI